jgi:hypothetical protein
MTAPLDKELRVGRTKAGELVVSVSIKDLERLVPIEVRNRNREAARRILRQQEQDVRDLFRR